MTLIISIKYPNGDTTVCTLYKSEYINAGQVSQLAISLVYMQVDLSHTTDLHFFVNEQNNGVTDLKGPSQQNRLSKVVWFNRLFCWYAMLDIQTFLALCFLVIRFRLLKQSTLNTYKLTILLGDSWCWHKLSSSWHQLFSDWHLNLSISRKGVALDGIGRRVVQLFHHVITSRFFLSPLERRVGDTSYIPITPRATPAKTVNQTEQQIDCSGWQRVRLHRFSLVREQGERLMMTIACTTSKKVIEERLAGCWRNQRPMRSSRIFLTSF